jgi:hypothetical protein
MNPAITTPGPRVLCLTHYTQPVRQTQKLIDTLRTRGWTVAEIPGLGLIDRVRSEMASAVCQMPGVEWMLWIDHDNVCNPDDIERLLESAEDADADAMFGLYVTRSRPARPVVEFDHAAPEWPTRNRGRISCGRMGYVYPVKRGGFGLTLTRPRLFHRVAEVLPRVRLGQNGMQAWPFFHPALMQEGPVEEGMSYIGEDYSLCDRARALGMRLLCDTRIRVGHVGEHEYGLADVEPPKPCGDTVHVNVTFEGGQAPWEATPSPERCPPCSSSSDALPSSSCGSSEELPCELSERTPEPSASASASAAGARRRRPAGCRPPPQREEAP